MKLKKVMAATLATMMCLSSFSMMNVWADKKEDSEPLVITLADTIAQGILGNFI